jgi:hypothetical protein
MLGGGASFAVVMAAASYSSGLVGFKSDVVEDEVERKEALKKMRRRPIEETVAELGEGRGMLTHTSNGLSAHRHRYLCAWLRGEEATAAVGEIWRRRRPSARREITNTNIFLTVLLEVYRTVVPGAKDQCHYGHMYILTELISVSNLAASYDVISWDNHYGQHSVALSDFSYIYWRPWVMYTC